MRVSGERYTDLPDKNWASHIADALQYACLGHETLQDAKQATRYRNSEAQKDIPVSAWT